MEKKYLCRIIQTSVLGVLVGTSLFSAANARADIVGGESVSDSDAWLNSVVALYQEGPQGGALCSATLIARNFALTAAHCVQEGTANMVVIFGHDISANTAQKVRVLEAEVPRAWKEKHLEDQDWGDIAVVRLEIPKGKGLKDFHPAHLAPLKLKLQKGDEVMLAGYGITDAHSHEGAGTLRKTQVQVVDPAFGKTEMIFDQAHGTGACHGDSGGPAFLEKNGKLYLVGVTNRGYPDGAPDDCAHRVVYAKVSAHGAWIRQVIKEMKKSRS